MSRFALVNARVLAEAGIVDGGALVIEDGRIIALTDAAGARAGPTTCATWTGRGWRPGFIDLQVNGGGGCCSTTRPPRGHRRHRARAS